MFVLLFVFACSSESDENNLIKIEKRKLVTFQDCEVDCPVMRFIPKGKFMMGALPYDKDATKWEKPRHQVEIKNDFYMSTFEITTGYYKLCVDDGGCNYMPQNAFDWCMSDFNCETWHIIMTGANENFKIIPGLLPVTGISVNDAKQYAAWMSKKTGQVYRLPTEEEWEYAARAGTGTIFWWGDEMEPGRTYCSRCDSNMPTGGRMPLNLGSYPGNPFGLHDMLGNASEVVGSCFDGDYSQKLEKGNKQNVNCKLYITKGGGVGAPVSWSRVSNRAGIEADKRFKDSGFRLVREIK